MTQLNSNQLAPDETPATAPRPRVVEFTAAHCPPCQRLAPLLAELAEIYKGYVDVEVVDIQEQTALAQRYGIRSVPTLLAIRNGHVVAQQVGFSNPRRVRELFAELGDT